MNSDVPPLFLGGALRVLPPLCFRTSSLRDCCIKICPISFFALTHKLGVLKESPTVFARFCRPYPFAILVLPFFSLVSHLLLAFPEIPRMDKELLFFFLFRHYVRGLPFPSPPPAFLAVFFAIISLLKDVARSVSQRIMHYFLFCCSSLRAGNSSS